ncbi:hypothetical protein SETIT_8G212600v2 [Setaria italica]|uniref:Transmembrane protein n=1 Tax=Setaria italica TaxID=4555 RepID=A0A368SAB5_SETIT|nr:hypothetical protein SETIT_8G212600v2 [Setaria italica]
MLCRRLFSGGYFAAVLCSSGYFATVVGCFGWMLCRHGRAGWVDALPLLLCLGGCFAAMILMSRWMLCHHCGSETFSTLDEVVSFSRFKRVVVSRFVGSSVLPLCWFVSCGGSLCVSSVFLFLWSFVLSCWSRSVWLHRDCVCKLLSSY